MEVKAEAKYLRISARKLRLVANAVKELSPSEALKHLRFINKKGAGPVAKLIASAVANAKNNFNLKEESLRIKSLIVGEGPTYKRWRPVSRGRAHPILKRTSHLKIVIEGEKS